MKQFFLNRNVGNNYGFFNAYYFISLFFCFVICFAIVINKTKIRKIIRNKQKWIRILFGSFLLIAWFLRRGSFIWYDVYNWRHHLDINFCSMTNIMMILYCFTGDKRLYVLCYYLIFSGPLIAILFPSINSSIFNYSTINFFIIHHVIFIFNLVFFLFESPNYNRRDMIVSHILIVFYVLFTYLFNYIFQTNYNTLQSFINNSFIVPDVISIVILFSVNSLCIVFAGFVFNKLELRG